MEEWPKRKQYVEIGPAIRREIWVRNGMSLGVVQESGIDGKEIVEAL